MVAYSMSYGKTNIVFREIGYFAPIIEIIFQFGGLEGEYIVRT